MFTGLIEGLGRVAQLGPATAGGRRLAVELPFSDGAEPGESVAVDGTCLTQLPPGGTLLVADLSAETLARTTLGGLAVGTPVNLERALRAGDRLGGHLAQGHVDRCERLLARSPEAGGGAVLRFSLATEAAPFLAPKGSVTVAGVSLTVATLGSGWFEAACVPHTLLVTTLGTLATGALVNVEFDVVAKTVLRSLALHGSVDLPEGTLRVLGVDPKRPQPADRPDPGT